jgi:hypothetical protein
VFLDRSGRRVTTGVKTTSGGRSVREYMQHVVFGKISDEPNSAADHQAQIRHVGVDGSGAL